MPRSRWNQYALMGIAATFTEVGKRRVHTVSKHHGGQYI